MWKKEEIRQFRKQLGLTQKEFAELLGVTREYVVYLERGKKKAGSVLCKLLDCLKEKMKGRF